jgi:hypothetical protein
VTNKILSTWPKLLLAIILNVAIWEIFFRLFISSPCTQIFDNELGYINQPCSEYLETMEGYSRTRFNSIGFNDQEPLKDNVNKRIFIVGDSYTEGFQVQKEINYAQVAEDSLNASDFLSKKIDIIKLARDGFIPVHFPIVISRYIETLKPELIFLQFSSHSGGDLYSKEVKATYSEAGELISLNMEPKLEDKYKNIFRNFLNNSSLLYYLMRKYNVPIINSIHKLMKYQDIKIKEKNASITNERHIEDMALRFTFLIKEIMKFDTKVVILYLPGPGEYLKDNKDHKDKIEPHETLQALELTAGKLNIPLLDTSEAFNKFYKEKHIPLNGFMNSLPGQGHLNKYGHKIVGDEIARYLKDLFIVHNNN